MPHDVRLSYIQTALDKKRTESPIGTTDTISMNGSFSVNLTVPLPSLKQLRDLLTGQLEGIYMQHLMSLAQNDLDRVGRLSGLSKPRI